MVVVKKRYHLKNAISKSGNCRSIGFLVGQFFDVPYGIIGNVPNAAADKAEVPPCCLRRVAVALMSFEGVRWFVGWWFGGFLVCCCDWCRFWLLW